MTLTSLVRNYNKYWILLVFKDNLWNAKFVAKNFAIPLFCRGTPRSEFFFSPCFGGHSLFYVGHSQLVSLHMHFRGHGRKLWRWFFTKQLPSFCEVCSSVSPPRIGRWLRSLLSSGSWRRVFWQSFVKVHPTRPTDTSFCPVYTTKYKIHTLFWEGFCISYLFQVQYLVNGSHCHLFRSQFWHTLLITGRVVWVRFTVGEGRLLWVQPKPSCSEGIGVNRP